MINLSWMQSAVQAAARNPSDPPQSSTLLSATPQSSCEILATTQTAVSELTAASQAGKIAKTVRRTTGRLIPLHFNRSYWSAWHVGKRKPSPIPNFPSHFFMMIKLSQKLHAITFSFFCNWRLWIAKMWRINVFLIKKKGILNLCTSPELNQRPFGIFLQCFASLN